MKNTFLSRLYIIAISLSLVAGLAEVQLIRFQVSPTFHQVSNWADEQFTYDKLDLLPTRGSIYDRYGRLLAGNEEVYQVGALLQFVRNPQTIIETIYPLIKDPDQYEYVEKAASTEYEEDSRVYANLVNFVSPNVISVMQDIKRNYELENPEGKDLSKPSLRGMVWYPQLKRSYPENDLAANVIGIYPYEELYKAKGRYGIEEYYNDLLAGNSEKIKMPVVPFMIQDVPELPTGASLVLTIDREIQAMLERKLDEEVKKNDAASGTIIIMDPRNGEIIAMATQPRINLNTYYQYEEELESEIPFNRAISQFYEPGSVFKPLTMAAAIDLGKVTPETIFNDPGVFQYMGATIYNWDRRAYGKQTMIECLQRSLNVCLSWVATEIGAEDFYRYLEAFGIGRKTNIDLGGEDTYPLRTPEDTYHPDDSYNWYPAYLVVNSFGQAVSVTPIQIATAISAIANNGRMMKPHVLKAIIDHDQQYDTNPQVLGVPISEQTARTLTEMLAVSLEKEASSALVPGYRIAGKTGTAEIPSAGGYTSDQTNASFVGWGPIDDPHFLIYIWIERPTSSPWGSLVAAPIFHDIVEELVKLMDIPPDEIRHALMAQG